MERLVSNSLKARQSTTLIKVFCKHFKLKHYFWHCVKSVQIQSFFWSVFSCIRTEYGPERFVFGHFSRSMDCGKLVKFQ